MIVNDLIEELKKFDPSLEVTISDSFEYLFYHTRKIELSVFTDVDGTKTCDIGIGGNRL